MRGLNKLFQIGAAGLFVVLASTPVHAMCKGKPRIDLSDGSKACVMAVKTTEITFSIGIEGTGPATTRKSSKDGGVVALHFLSEPDARSVPFRAINARAKAICQRYKPTLLAKIAKPGDPFMVAVFSWGKKPARASKGLSQTYREIYLSKNCWVKEHQ